MIALKSDEYIFTFTFPTLNDHLHQAGNSFIGIAQSPLYFESYPEPNPKIENEFFVTGWTRMSTIEKKKQNH